jgi:hypothetical protein
MIFFSSSKFKNSPSRKPNPGFQAPLSPVGVSRRPEFHSGRLDAPSDKKQAGRKSGIPVVQKSTDDKFFFAYGGQEGQGGH